MIVLPDTSALSNSGQLRPASAVMSDMTALLRKRKNLQINRKRFLSRWGRLRSELEHTPEYQEFRQLVLDRDGFVCQSCGSYGRIVHHHRRVALAVHLALDPGNASVRCADCHEKVHPWLRKAS